MILFVPPGVIWVDEGKYYEPIVTNAETALLELVEWNALMEESGINWFLVQPLLLLLCSSDGMFLVALKKKPPLFCFVYSQKIVFVYSPLGETIDI